MTNYHRLYRLGLTPWEGYREAAAESVRRVLDREEVGRPRPLGRALDIGCGRGQYTPELARRGWEAVGVDHVPAAVAAARRAGPDEVTYVVGDATDLEAGGLGRFDLFLDIGCFQGFDERQRRAEGRGVTALANRGATVLMLAFGPSPFRRLVGGVSQDEVAAAFPEWELLSVDPAETTGLGFPMNRTSPQWYRLRLRDERRTCPWWHARRHDDTGGRGPHLRGPTGRRGRRAGDRRAAHRRPARGDA